jgi:hypothetical protein
VPRWLSHAVRVRQHCYWCCIPLGGKCAWQQVATKLQLGADPAWLCLQVCLNAEGGICVIGLRTGVAEGIGCRCGVPPNGHAGLCASSVCVSCAWQQLATRLQHDAALVCLCLRVSAVGGWCWVLMDMHTGSVHLETHPTLTVHIPH